MADRRGVLLYFDLTRSIDKLTDPQAGRLFKAIMLYASTGALPDFDNDIALSVAWGFVQDKIDRDGERYNEICRKNKENQLHRWERERERANTTVYDRIPTTTATAAATQPHPQPQSQPQPNRNPTADAEGGAGGDRFSMLSPKEQLELLKREAGL